MPEKTKRPRTEAQKAATAKLVASNKAKREAKKALLENTPDDGGEAADRAGGTEPIDLEGVTLRPPEVAASRKTKGSHSPPIFLVKLTTWRKMCASV